MYFREFKYPIQSNIDKILFNIIIFKIILSYRKPYYLLYHLFLISKPHIFFNINLCIFWLIFHNTHTFMLYLFFYSPIILMNFSLPFSDLLLWSSIGIFIVFSAKAVVWGFEVNHHCQRSFCLTYCLFQQLSFSILLLDSLNEWLVERNLNFTIEVLIFSHFLRFKCPQFHGLCLAKAWEVRNFSLLCCPCYLQSFSFFDHKILLFVESF